MTDYLDIAVGGGEDTCPSCGSSPAIDGATEGCYDVHGCGADLTTSTNEEDEEYYFENEEDVDELNFD